MEVYRKFDMNTSNRIKKTEPKLDTHCVESISSTNTIQKTIDTLDIMLLNILNVSIIPQIFLSSAMHPGFSEQLSAMTRLMRATESGNREATNWLGYSFTSGYVSPRGIHADGVFGMLTTWVAFHDYVLHKLNTIGTFNCAYIDIMMWFNKQWSPFNTILRESFGLSPGNRHLIHAFSASAFSMASSLTMWLFYDANHDAELCSSANLDLLNSGLHTAQPLLPISCNLAAQLFFNAAIRNSAEGHINIARTLLYCQDSCNTTDLHDNLKHNLANVELAQILLEEASDQSSLPAILTLWEIALCQWFKTFIDTIKLATKKLIDHIESFQL